MPETWPVSLYVSRGPKSVEQYKLTLRSVDVHIQLQLLSSRLDVLETLLVVRTCTTNPDLNIVLDQDRGEFPKGADDTLEGRCNVLCNC